MHNNVVDAMENGFSSKGFTTLKFNFRGVGASAGMYDEGEGEVRDVVASLMYLKTQIDTDAFVLLAGYSFGAWVASRAAAGDEDVDGLFLVAFPFSFYGADEIRQFKKSIYFVGGEYDEISPIDNLLTVYKDLPIVEKYLKVISTDHFYGGKEREIEEFIRESFQVP